MPNDYVSILIKGFPGVAETERLGIWGLCRMWGNRESGDGEPSSVSQPSTVNRQPSSIINYQLSIINYQLSIINYQSVISEPSESIIITCQ